MSYNPRIILAKIATYYSHNYAGTLGSQAYTIDPTLLGSALFYSPRLFLFGIIIMKYIVINIWPG